MDKKMHILIVEDSATDVELITRELGKGALAHTTKWVKSKEEFLKALAEYAPDIILCDYKMPLFGALKALEIVKERSPETPFIVVSGAMGEDLAVEIMKSGAVDYVMKDRLVRLVPAVERALKEAQGHAERKRMEKELAQAKESQFRTLIENLPQKVFLKDKNSVYLSCNKGYARDLKIRPEEIAGKTDYNFFPTQLAEKYRSDDRRIMESGKTESWEEGYYLIGDYLRGSGESFIRIVKAPVLDREGNVTGLFGLFWDITEQKKLEGEKDRVKILAFAAETKNRFASTVSHELRSPIAVIIGALDIALDGLTGQINDELKEILEIAKKNGERLISLIGNVLDFQKIESGKMEYNISEHGLNEAMKEVCKSMGVLAKGKGLELRMELEERLPGIKFDRDKLIQVLMNLANNAIRHTESGGVTLFSKKEDGAVHVRVQDTGSGIPAEEIHKLFQPFEQVGDFSSRQKGGTGLGLAISKEIILTHHGKIWVESEVGKGSSFHFTLPL